MASRLSSLLVRDGLVSVKRMEKAFQRQVIYGGALDTILLEMNLVPEERLLQYLSLSTGVPPATRSETEAVDDDAVELCGREIANRFEVAPLRFDGETLRVLVKEPVDFNRLESLANALELPIQPLVVPEYRFSLVLRRAFGEEEDARFRALDKRSRAGASPTPVGKAPSVIVQGAEQASQPPDETTAPAPQPAASGLHSRTKTLIGTQLTSSSFDRSPATGVPRAVLHEYETYPFEDEAGAAEVGAPAESGGVPETSGPEEVTGPTRPVVKIASPKAITDRRPAVEPPIDLEIGTAGPADTNGSGRALSESAAVPIATERALTVPDQIGAHPLSVQEAREALAVAGGRDVIFETLLRAIRGRAAYAGLLTVQGKEAIGRVASTDGSLDSIGIAEVRIPLDLDSAFKTVTSSRAPHVGPIATGDGKLNAMLGKLGGVLPASALLLPIALRERVVAIAVGHRGEDEISMADVADVLPLADDTAEAISRLIVEAKRAGSKPGRSDSESASGSAAPAHEPAEPNATAAPATAAEPPAETQPNGAAATAAEPSGDGGGGHLQLVEPAAKRRSSGRDPGERPPQAIDVLLDVIEGDRDAGGTATAEVLRRASESVAALGARFPGRLTVDRYALGGRSLRAERHGPLLALVVKLGTAAAPMLIEKMQDEQRDIRYYAALCTAELRPREGIEQLVSCLFDSDYAIRRVAIEGLAGYPARELTGALGGARKALHSADTAQIEAAAAALGELADVDSVPDLLDAMAAREGRNAPAVRGALVQLTKQDLGTNARKWRTWWSKNKDRSRIEWLLDGLGHKNGDIRKSSAEDLRRLTGEYFGFHHDLPKRERDGARRKWLDWWNEAGRRRFLRSTDDSSGGRT